MRQLGVLASDTDARRLADYLLTLDIVTKLDSDGDGWVIWVRQEDQLDQARRELAEFLADPQGERYRKAATAASQLRREEARRDAEAQKKIVDVRDRWTVRGNGGTPLTWLMIAASVWVAIQSGFGDGNQEALHGLFIADLKVTPTGELGWSLEDHLRHGEIWRLFTPMFIHFGRMHLLFNMMWLYDLGRRIELLVGTMRFLALVLVIQLVSGLAQYWVQGPLFGGMSGVVYGLFGYAWMQYRYGACSMLYLGQLNVFLMIGCFVLGARGYLGPVANWAHGGGLVAGMLLGLMPIWWQKLRRG